MSKFKNGLTERVKIEEDKIKEQKQLHQKYSVTDENVVVVEKSNTYKFTINAIKGILKTATTIIIFFFTVFGIVSIIYPGTRIILIKQLIDVLDQVQQYIQEI